MTCQCGYSEDLNRQSCDGYTPLMIIKNEVLLQLLIVLKRQSWKKIITQEIRKQEIRKHFEILYETNFLPL